MIHRNRVQRPPFERLRSLYAGAVGMPPVPPEMLPVPTEALPMPTPRHAVGVDVAEMEDLEAAVHAARARAACNSARRALRDVARAGAVSSSEALRGVAERTERLAPAAVSRRDQLEAMRSAAAVARREALR